MRWLLLTTLLSVSVYTSGCSVLNPEKETITKIEYVKKPKLVLPPREKPVMSKNIEWKVEKNNVYLTRKYFESLLVDLVALQSYIESLQADLESYKSYYEAD